MLIDVCMKYTLYISWSYNLINTSRYTKQNASQINCHVSPNYYTSDLGTCNALILKSEILNYPFSIMLHNIIIYMSTTSLKLP